jgi:iron complex transport system permease protein
MIARVARTQTAPPVQAAPAGFAPEGRAIAQGLRRRATLTAAALVALLVVAAARSASVGVVEVSAAQVVSLLAESVGLGPLASDVPDVQRAAFWVIRLPRVLFGALLGASLAIAGASMQGLMRNPLADPGLVGTSSGGALGAALVIVVGWRYWPQAMAGAGAWALPLGAGLGALAATAAVYRLASRRGRADLGTLVLAGVAVNALVGAGLGLMIHWADEAQLRDLTAWSLGGLGRATWGAVKVGGVVMAAATLALLREGGRLNAALLGEDDARSLGVDVQALRRRVIGWAALAVGAGVSFAGVVGFVGLVVPHLLRLWMGADHRALLTCSALLGASTLLLADVAARTWAAPAELPLGVVTSLLGAPFFLWLLARYTSHAAEGR